MEDPSMSEPENHHIKAIWGAQPVEPELVTVEQIRARADQFQAGVRRRNWIEYGAAVTNVAVFGSYIWIFPVPLMQLGSLLIIAATLFVAIWLRFRASVKPIPLHLSFMEYASRYREELQRQQSALRTVWLWYIAPFVPGAVLFTVGMARIFEQTLGSRFPLWILAVDAVVLVGVSAVVWLLNLRAARKLQHKIDAVSRMLVS
jgi:hypothetical protein